MAKLLLISCGSIEDSTVESSVSNNGDRQIKHAMGTTKVRETPNRIVVSTNKANDNILALGVMSIGAVKSWWGSPYFEYIQSEL